LASITARAAAGDRVAVNSTPATSASTIKLHHNREFDGVVVDAVAVPVGDGPVRPQRGPAPPHGVQHRVRADDVEVRVLWPAKLANGRSSAVADDRTATGASAPNCRYRARISSAMSAGISTPSNTPAPGRAVHRPPPA